MGREGGRRQVISPRAEAGPPSPPDPRTLPLAHPATSPLTLDPPPPVNPSVRRFPSLLDEYQFLRVIFFRGVISGCCIFK